MLSNNLDEDSRRALLWLRRVNNLPAFPPVVQETLALLDDLRSNASDVATVIGRDEAITARILRTVNSAFYGVRGTVTTVSHAVTLLGFDQLRMMIMGTVLLGQGQDRDPLAESNRTRVWEHSTACARWAQVLARATRYSPAEEASVAGLLHDVGKIVIGISVPQQFAEAVALSQTEGLESHEAEDRRVGFNHLGAGEMVAERWRFPSPIRRAVALHHGPWPLPLDDNDPATPKLRQLLAVVQVANQAARQSLAEHPPSGDAGEVSFPIGPEQLEQRVAQVTALLGS